MEAASHSVGFIVGPVGTSSPSYISLSLTNIAITSGTVTTFPTGASLWKFEIGLEGGREEGSYG